MPLITPSHSSNPSTLKDTAPILYPCTRTPGHTHTHPHTALALARGDDEVALGTDLSDYAVPGLENP